MHICFFFRTFVAQMSDIIQYIITFLLYGNEAAANQVGYTDDKSQWSNYRVIIVPNGSLGKQIVIPDLEETKVELINETDKDGNNRWIIQTDIIYNSFFFISRAEELINHQRDEHGRFLAKHSILGKQNRLMIPTIDEYSRILMKLMDLPLPAPSFNQIYLTHDVDSIEHYRHLRGAIGGILRGKWREVLAALKDIHNDPAFTFSWLISQDKQLQEAEVVYFIKDTQGKGYDYPQYKLDSQDFEIVEQLIKNSGAKVGLHSSYYGPKSTLVELYGRLINQQKIQPQKQIYHRSHYLNCSIDQMQQWVNMGVTDDFTMMFPDCIGFRLQTTRPVRWINPKTMQLTSLTLHPMTVMDCTLSNSNYMNLNEDEAYFECQRLFEKIHQNRGEVVLLWHNTNLMSNTYHSSLYPKLLELLD